MLKMKIIKTFLVLFFALTFFHAT